VLSLYVIKNWTASASAYQFVLFPFVTITVGAWLAHEAISGVVLVGGALVLAGAYIGSIAKTEQLKSAWLRIFSRAKAPEPECSEC
jgi:drug/metabolite transporter (DMT)-like permease